MREVLLGLIWLRVLVVGDFPALDREDAKLLALKELKEMPVDIRELEEFEGLELLILELEDLEELEGLELLILELEDLEELEGLELLILELEDLEETETLEELDDLEELEALEGAELLEADRLLPLDLLLLERDDLAITGPVSSIKDKTIENRIALRFFDCFRVNMACLLIF